MSEWRSNEVGGPDGMGRDVQLGEALRSLDPATRDPNYWFRFRGWVVKSAARELARRRMMVDMTVGDVLSSWARTLVPTAALAAALAGLLLMREAGPTPEQAAYALEELLVSEIPGETVPVLLSADGTQGVVALAVETF